MTTNCTHKGTHRVCPKCKRMVPDECPLEAPAKAVETQEEPVATEVAEEDPKPRRGRWSPKK